MIYENLLLHNVADIQPVNDGVRLQRVPESVRQQLNPNAQDRVLMPFNCEIRFTTDAPQVELTLSSESETQIRIFHGPFDSKIDRIIGTEPTTITITRPPILMCLERKYWQDQPFDPHVYRVIFGGLRKGTAILHGIKGGNIQPPRPEQLPNKTYLAYGTSITQGAKSEAPHLAYVAQTAWHLGADLINLGVGGACQCEPAFADYIASRDDWHFASLELSVNMQGFAIDEFRERVKYMVRTVGAANPSRQVACITLSPFARDFIADQPNAKPRGTPEQYRQALRDAVASCNLPNLHLIEGNQILTNLGGLSIDLLHPSDNAMIEMGRNLAAQFKPLLP